MSQRVPPWVSPVWDSLRFLDLGDCCLSAGWGRVPTLLVVWPEASQCWSLQAVWGTRSWCQGPKISASSQSSHRSLLCPSPVFMTPERATAAPTFAGGSPRPAGRSGPSSYGVTPFALGPVAYNTLCAHSKSGVSVSPRTVGLLHSSPAGLQRHILWGLHLPMSDL